MNREGEWKRSEKKKKKGEESERLEESKNKEEKKRRSREGWVGEGVELWAPSEPECLWEGELEAGLGGGGSERWIRGGGG